MKHLSSKSLEMVAAGRNFSCASANVAGYSLSVPYPTAKGAKNFLKESKVIAMGAGYLIGEVVKSKVAAYLGDEHSVTKSIPVISAGAGLVAHMFAEDCFDDVYAHNGLASGSDK